MGLVGIRFKQPHFCKQRSCFHNLKSITFWLQRRERTDHCTKAPTIFHIARWFPFFSWSETRWSIVSFGFHIGGGSTELSISEGLEIHFFQCFKVVPQTVPLSHSQYVNATILFLGADRNWLYNVKKTKTLSAVLK